MKKLITKGDLVLLAVFLLSAGLILAVPALRTAAAGSGSDEDTDSPELLLEVCVDGESIGTWPLSEDESIVIRNDHGTNLLTIADGAVSMTESDCRNQICVNTGSIRAQGQMIICLPHRLSAEIIAAEETEDTLDAISR